MSSQFPVLFLDKGKTKINPDLFGDKAEEFAKDWSSLEKKNQSSQIRKFYDQLIYYQDRLKESSSWDEIFPLIQMVIPKAVYSQARGHVTEDFCLFIKELKNVGSEKELEVFLCFFESIIAYKKLEEERKKNKNNFQQKG